eukprot:Pompholyxophrys_punicea_v1_NODE_1135_length_920_cov_5.352601.p1 type:complete len:141 gc:universal NODE_1135_length_920_cov_5.352601:354-776(+)
MVSAVKFLGVHLNSSLSWTDHTTVLLKKLTRFSGLFYLLRRLLSTSSLLSLYNALVLPHLSYGIELWGSSDPTAGYLRPIYLLQKRLVRHISHRPRLAHTAPLFCKPQRFINTSLGSLPLPAFTNCQPLDTSDNGHCIEI